MKYLELRNEKEERERRARIVVVVVVVVIVEERLGGWEGEMEDWDWD